MEIIILFILWIISIPVCVKYARKIGGNTVVAGLAGLVAPILAPIGYAYVASNSREGKVQTSKVWAQFGKFVALLVVGYWLLELFR